MKKFLLSALFLFLSQFTIQANSELSAEELRREFSSHGVVPLFTLKHKTYSAEKFELGRLLFFDKILSGNKNISCAACHHSHFGSGDELPLSIGEGGEGLGKKRELKAGHLIPRNAPPVFNRGFDDYHTVMWDGRIRKGEKPGTWQTPEAGINGENPEFAHVVEPLESILAVQALFPISSEHEMLGAFQTNEVSRETDRDYMWMRLRERILKIERYRELLFKAYPEVKESSDFNFGHIANAVGAFEAEAFRADRTDFDYFLAGKKELTKREMRGAQLFLNKGACISCHNGPFLSDFDNHALAVPQMGPGKEEAVNDRGLELQTKNPMDRYKFKTPTLRNVELTGPWMHDGYFTNLKEVIKHHVNAQSSLLKHISSKNHQKHKQLFIKTLDRDFERNRERMSFLSPKLASLPRFSEDEIHDLYLFLLTLTDRSFKERVKNPLSVPSGLSVDK